uniref:Uncharacterized protein n=1 Tax=Anopheles stephensi TaxID=30069 RepID=A0A182YTH1_ANOST
MANLMTVRLQRGDGQAWGFRLQGGKDFSAPLVLQRVSIELEIKSYTDVLTTRSLMLKLIITKIMLGDLPSSFDQYHRISSVKIINRTLDL